MGFGHIKHRRYSQRPQRRSENNAHQQRFAFHRRQRSCKQRELVGLGFAQPESKPSNGGKGEEPRHLFIRNYLLNSGIKEQHFILRHSQPPRAQNEHDKHGDSVSIWTTAHGLSDRFGNRERQAYQRFKGQELAAVESGPYDKQLKTHIPSLQRLHHAMLK